MFAGRTKLFSRSYSAPAKLLEKIPGPPLHPEHGTGAEFLQRIAKNDIVVAIDSYYSEYGNIVRQRIRGEDEVWIYNPTDMSAVFQNDRAIPTGLTAELWPVTEYMEKRKRPFPLNTKTEVWRRVRSLVQKDIFPPQAALSYLSPIDQSASAAVKFFDRVESFDKIMPYAVFDMFLSATLGRQFNTTERSFIKDRVKDDLDRYMESTIEGLSKMIQLMYYVGDVKENHAKFDAAIDVVMEVSDKLLFETIQRPDFAQSNSYLKKLLQRGEITHAEAVETVTTFLLAGLDTTSYLSLWVLLNLGRFPDVQDKVYEEMKSVVGDGPLQERHIDKFEYLKQVMRESHRYTPTSPSLIRRTLDKPIVLSGYEIPANTRIVCCTNTIQHDPKFVENPHQFKPERWTKEAIASRKGTPLEVLDSTLLGKPFGFGPRMCLGARLADLEVKVLLYHLLKNWRFHWNEKEQQYKVALYTLTTAEPYPKMTVKPR